MERKLSGGDYLPGSQGGVQSLDGAQALLQRVLFRLTARRGQFPFWETLGSRLWTLGQLPAGKRQPAAEQFVAEALAEVPGLTVEQVTLDRGAAGRSRLTADLTWNGESLRATVDVE